MSENVYTITESELNKLHAMWALDVRKNGCAFMSPDESLSIDLDVLARKQTAYFIDCLNKVQGKDGHR